MSLAPRGTRIALDTIGCKLNQAETELLAKQLAEAGYQLVASAGEADIYILNTCTVTHVADSKCRHLLRLAHRQNRHAWLVATGCYAERASAELGRIEGVGLVLGNKAKADLAQRLERCGYLCSPCRVRLGPARRSLTSLRTRAFIKIQDGCRNYCAYCIVPLVRGEEKSVPVDQIINQVNQRVADGYQEVVLTGTRVGAYNDNGVNLKGLIERILAGTSVIRLRLSSLQPGEISLGLIGLWSDKRLCPHFHLSLQSGSDTVLSRMRRRYTTADYRQAVALIRHRLPEVAITTDVIVGFPGETETEFKQSCDFCRRMRFARIHVFTYSPRQETNAAHLPAQIDARVKQRRNQQMLALAKESTPKFNRLFLSKTRPVLWEKRSSGVWSGYTDNYIKVYTRSNHNLANQLMPVELIELNGDGMWGLNRRAEPVPSPL